MTTLYNLQTIAKYYWAGMPNLQIQNLQIRPSPSPLMGEGGAKHRMRVVKKCQTSKTQ